ncbi:MAG: hypothetical protein ABL908_03855 [Hyphomicrobium sp.]
MHAQAIGGWVLALGGLLSGALIAARAAMIAAPARSYDGGNRRKAARRHHTDLEL